MTMKVIVVIYHMLLFNLVKHRVIEFVCRRRVLFMSSLKSFKAGLIIGASG